MNSTNHRLGSTVVFTVKKYPPLSGPTVKSPIVQGSAVLGTLCMKRIGRKRESTEQLCSSQDVVDPYCVYVSMHVCVLKIYL